MRISVVIPYYNNKSTICKTLDSLIAQSVDLYEVIIVDDCSIDKNEAQVAIAPFEKKLPIVLLKNNENKNGAFSRNRGINYSSGDIVAFLDADDSWLPIKAQRILDYTKMYGVNTIFFSKVKVETNGVVSSSRPTHFNSNIHMSEYLFLEDGFIQTSSIFCGSNLAKQILFKEEFNRHQDYDFVLRAGNLGIDFKFINEELIIYRGDVKTNLSKGEAYMYSKTWAKKMRKYFSKTGFLGFQIFNLTARLLAEKRYFKAIGNLLQGLIYLNPTVYPRLFPKLKRLFTQKVKL
jgi:glycosyltransferase involved in cell wall biosynthesis